MVGDVFASGNTVAGFEWAVVLDLLGGFVLLVVQESRASCFRSFCLFVDRAAQSRYKVGQPSGSVRSARILRRHR